MAGQDTEGPASGIEELLLQVRAFEHGLRKAIAAVCSRHGVPEGGWSVLEVLANGRPQTVPQIGRLRATSRQNIQMLVNRLQRRGWVESVGNPAHKRSSLISLTEKGTAVAREVAASQASVLEGLSGRCSEAELGAAASLLRRLRQLVAEAAEGLGTSASARRVARSEGARSRKRALEAAASSSTAREDVKPPPEASSEDSTEDGE